MTRLIRRLFAVMLATILLVAGIPFCAFAAMLGDLDGSGELSVRDALALYQYTSSNTTVAPSTAVADMDGNGTVNMRDALALFRRVSGAENAGAKIRNGITDESVYMKNISVTNEITKKVFTGETKEKLQLAVAEVVKFEIGMSTFGKNNNETWKAFAVAAYTLLARHCYNGDTYAIAMGSDINLNNSTDKRIYDAVGEVLGIKIAYNDPKKSAYNQLCQMFYSASSAGVTCSTFNAWGYVDLEYLQPVQSTYDNAAWIAECSAGIDAFEHSFQITMTELLACVARWKGVDKVYYDTDGAFSLYARQKDGPYWAYSNLYYYNSSGTKKYVSGVDIYTAINYYGKPHCYSHAITVTAQSGETLTISTKGNGHGIGISQYGAAGYANEAGWTYDRIIAHYYNITDDTAWGLVGPKW